MQGKSRDFFWLGHHTILGANVLEKAIYFEVGRGGVYMGLYARFHKSVLVLFTLMKLFMYIILDICN